VNRFFTRQSDRHPRQAGGDLSGSQANVLEEMAAIRS
jgi:hypothetical protein